MHFTVSHTALLNNAIHKHFIQRFSERDTMYSKEFSDTDYDSIVNDLNLILNPLNESTDQFHIAMKLVYDRIQANCDINLGYYTFSEHEKISDALQSMADKIMQITKNSGSMSYIKIGRAHV